MGVPVTINVAFADDHTIVRNSIIRLIESDKKSRILFTQQAGNGQQLLHELEKATQLPDICILDINMPKMDGHSTLVAIKSRWPQMKFLILTAFDDEFAILRLIKAGAGGYLLKSCDDEEIVAALHNIYETGYHFSSAADASTFKLVETRVAKRAFEFTDAELELLRYSTTHMSYAEIAKQMNTTEKSIEGTRDRLCNKLNIKTRVELCLFAFQSGLVMDDNI